MAVKKSPIASIPAALEIDTADVPDIAKGLTSRDPRIVSVPLGVKPAKPTLVTMLAMAIKRQTVK